jgi:hypothetical protein
VQKAVRSDGLEVVRTRLAVALAEADPLGALLCRVRNPVQDVSVVVPPVLDVEVRAASVADYDVLLVVTP